MTPDDLAALLKWLYANDDGSGWLPAAAADLRLNDRNLRGMLAGKVEIPVKVRVVICALVAAHSLLLGWADRAAQLDTLQLSEEPRILIEEYRRLL